MVTTRLNIDENTNSGRGSVLAVNSTTQDHEPTAQNVSRESRPATRYVTEHLTCFNCFPQDSKTTSAPDEIYEYAELCTSLAKFQGSMKIPQTGVFDITTEEHLRKPHCHNHSGHRQFIQLSNSNQNRKFQYCFERYSDQLDIVEVRAIFAKAFQEWSRVSQQEYTFTEVPPQYSGSVVIKIRWCEDYDKLDHDSATTGTFGLKKPAKLQSWKDEFVSISYFPHPAKEKLALDAQVDICFDQDRVNTIPLLRRIAFHQIGHIFGLGHSDTKAAVMWPGYSSLDYLFNQPAQNTCLHTDDIQAIRTKYEACNSGSEYGKWNQILDSQPERVSQIVAARGNLFYRLDANGSVWEYLPAGTWEEIVTANSSDSCVVQIDASSYHLYLLRQNGQIWSRSSSGGLKPGDMWTIIDSETEHPKIIRSARDGTALYKLQEQFWVSVFSDQHNYDWNILDGNPSEDKTFHITTNNSQVFFMHLSGRVYVADEIGRSYREIHGSSKTAQLVGAGYSLYRLDISGEIFEWKGDYGQEWWKLDDDSANVKIAAAGPYLFLYRQNGDVWYTNRQGKVSEDPAEWLKVADIGRDKVLQLSAADSSLYCLVGDGSIHKITIKA